MSDRTGLGRSTLYAYMQDCPTGDSGRVQALRKRIDYLVAADKHREALESAETLVGEATDQALGMEELVGACYSIAYQERAKVVARMGENAKAFDDHIRAIWWWQNAMRLQGREREHSPSRAAKRLTEEAAALKVDIAKNLLQQKTATGILFRRQRSGRSRYRYCTPAARYFPWYPGRSGIVRV